MAIFNSYVKLPEGIMKVFSPMFRQKDLKNVRGCILVEIAGLLNDSRKSRSQIEDWIYIQGPWGHSCSHSNTVLVVPRIKNLQNLPSKYEELLFYPHSSSRFRRCLYVCTYTPFSYRGRFWGSGAGKKDAKIIRWFWKSILGRF